jgi:bacteriocin-like protein
MFKEMNNEEMMTIDGGWVGPFIKEAIKDICIDIAGDFVKKTLKENSKRDHGFQKTGRFACDSAM